MKRPVHAPQTGQAKRGPKTATASQGNYLENQAARRPTVTPTTPPNQPSPFSASGPGTAPSPSAGAGLSASAPSSIPAASSAGASSTPASLNQVPSGSGMKRGGAVSARENLRDLQMDEALNSPKRYAAGGTTETNQYGSWGGANTANAVAGAAPASSYGS
jgi:hypothetical protein